MSQESLDRLDGRPRHRIAALIVEPKRGEKFLIPMDMRTAHNVAAMMLETVYGLAPQLSSELFQ
jgi:hypothetical protein